MSSRRFVAQVQFADWTAGVHIATHLYEVSARTSGRPTSGAIGWSTTCQVPSQAAGRGALVGRAEHLGFFVFTDDLVFSFLNPVSAITLAFGDNGGHDDSPARIETFDAFGNVLGVFDTPYPKRARTTARLGR